MSGVRGVVGFYLFGEGACDFAASVLEFVEPLVVGVFGEAVVKGLEFGLDGAALGDELGASGECAVKVVVEEVVAVALVFEQGWAVGADGKEPSVDVAFGEAGHFSRPSIGGNHQLFS